MRKKRRQFEIAKAWAWEFDNFNPLSSRKKRLCSWASPDKERLRDQPTSNAMPVEVYIIRRKDFDTRQT